MSSKFFKVEGEKAKKLMKECPECGPGYYMAEHKDRWHCGSCTHTEMK